jgi:hypothetical protein
MVSPKLATCELASNPPLFSKICHLFLKSATFLLKSAGFSENSWVLAPKSPLGGWGGGGLGSHLVPPLLSVNSSSFFLVLLNYRRSGFFY